MFRKYVAIENVTDISRIFDYDLQSFQYSPMINGPLVARKTSRLFYKSKSIKTGFLIYTEKEV